MQILFENDDYQVDYISSKKDRLLLLFKNPPVIGVENIEHYDEDDSIARVISKHMDVITIRSKSFTHMNDAPIDEAIDKIQELLTNYNKIYGLFICGGAVPGLFYSKRIPYDKIYLDCARFLEGYIHRLNNLDEFKYNNHKVCVDHINCDVIYEIHYCEDGDDPRDKITVDWLMNCPIKANVISHKHISNDEVPHPLISALGGRNYIKMFLSRIINEKIN